MNLTVPGIFNLEVLSPRLQNDSILLGKMNKYILETGLDKDSNLIKIIPTPGFSFYDDHYFKNVIICF